MKLNSLHDLYVDQLRDLYDAEQQIIKALPEMIDAASSAELKQALSEHLDVTKAQATRLDQIFNSLNEKSKGGKCKGMKGVLDEGSNLVDDIEDLDVRDAAIIASAQRVEHYEMAGYGTAQTFAGLLDDQQSSQLLQETLDEEKQADQTLTQLASQINVNAGGKTSRSAQKPRRERVA